MNIAEIADRLNFEIVCGSTGKNNMVTWGYTSDMLSNVMGNASEGNLWITMQSHKNILAVALLKELSGIVLVNGHRPDTETVTQAEKEGVVILATDLPAFETAGRLYQLLKENEDIQS
ncbi:MAG: serine kinase [Bacteroidales bacterium]|nr:serine kinase [Bacteroidales bacterium]